MSATDDIIAQQRAWAASQGLADAAGYLSTVTANLRSALSPQAQQAFERGDGGELKDTASRPAKMRALHSSSALAVNVFDYWTGRDPAPLGGTLDLGGDARSLRFEAQFPTGLDGNPPNLDLAVVLANGTAVGVESKFTEWLHAKAQQREAFKPKYFPDGAGLWQARGLRQSQALAQAMGSGEKVFRHFDAAQLLKHALGLATQAGDIELKIPKLSHGSFFPALLEPRRRIG